jgi:hypothetical protein
MNDLLNLVSLPTYTTKIPSTGKEITYRPFVVKEEKILLMATESKNEQQVYNAIKTIFESCFRDKLNLEEIPYFDAEYLFVKLRIKSMGEVVEIIVKDPVTGEKFETAINLDKIQVENLKDNKEFNIELSKELGITVKYPTLKGFKSLTENEDRTGTDGVIDLICNSIQTIYTKEQVISTKDKTFDEIKEFVENLSKDMFSKLGDFFMKLPTISYYDEFVSPSTGNKIPIIIKDFKNFFI